MTFTEAYQKLFDGFTQSNNLDQNDEYWPAEAKADFDRRYAELLITYGRTPL